MRILVESFKRLYNSGKLELEQISERVTTGKIDTEEYEYITGEALKNENS